jgi:hypothetical protein
MGVENLYFTWLLNSVSYHQSPQDERKVVDILSILHSIDYFSLISGDENRYADALELRSEFVELSGCSLPEDFLIRPPTTLEFFIALANRIGLYLDESANGWFWEMLGNLGIYRDSFSGDVNVDWVKETIFIFLSRDFNKNGTGGIFPNRYSNRDQRTLEVRYQFNEYILND